MDEKEKELETNVVLEEKKEENDDKPIGMYWPYLLVITVLLFFCVFGITYSVYKGDGGSDSEIITDQIVFSYTEVDKAGNGINIKNAIPTKDAVGKVLTGKNQYFDFNITATTGNSKVRYQVLIDKDDASTLSDRNVRIYLTQLTGNYENGLILDSFSNLKTKKKNNKEYYVLYDKVLPKGLKAHIDAYRLRMWVAENATDYDSKKFSLKVDVYAEQTEE